MTVGQQANLDCLWPQRPQCRHQTLQDPSHSPCTMSIVPRGMHQEHHICQAARTPWALCDGALRTPHALPNRREGEDIGVPRFQSCHTLGARDPRKCLGRCRHFLA